MTHPPASARSAAAASRAGGRSAARGLVVFDCDGVLVDSMGIDMRELTAAIAAAGGTLSERAVHHAFHGVSLGEIERGVSAHLGRPLPDGWMQRFLANRAAAFERELQPVPGAAEAIAGVRAAGWETCIASGGALHKMELTLTITGLRGAIADERIFSASMVEHPKPAPDLFLHAAAVCGFAPEACVVVEDSVPGVTAARAAGMRALGYAGGDASLAERLVQLGAEPVDTLTDLPGMLAGDDRAA